MSNKNIFKSKIPAKREFKKSEILKKLPMAILGQRMI